MVVVKVDSRPVASASAARDALQAGSLQKGLLLEVRSSEGGVNYLMVRTAANG